LYKKYGSFIQGISILKIIISTAVVAIFVKFMDFQGIFLILGYLIAFLGYLAVLYLLQEIKSQDIERVVRLFS
jgi:Sec7-like guanine-nucleotide exchange factor